MVDKRVKQKIDGRFSSDSIPMRIKDLRKRLEIDQKVLAEHLGVSQGTISEWENGDHTVPPMALMAIGRMDYENTEWWYEKAGPRFVERLKLTRVIQKVRAERARPVEQTDQSRPVEMKPPSPVPWDREVMAFAIETVDQELKKRGRTLPIDKYAQMIVLFYELCHETKSQDPDMVERLLMIA
jgi:transcriptional regulator with XRE-family HTH domain